MITLLIHRLEVGGAEKALVQLATLLSRKGFSVRIATLDSLPTRLPYSIPDEVQLVELGVSLSRLSVGAKILRSPKLLYSLRAFLSREELVVSFMQQTTLLCLLLAFGTPVRLVANEQIFPEAHAVWRLPLVGKFLQVLRNLLYRRAEAIVVQSEGARASFPTGLHSQIVVIPNIIDPVDKTCSLECEREEFILCVGRFVSQKRFDRAIEAFASVSETFPSWKLVLCGKGEAESSLRQHAHTLGVTDRVVFAGHVSNLSDYYSRCGLFLLTSDFEGFPNVLCEAMAHGAPVLAADCPTGPADLIDDGANGLLFPPDNFATLVEKLTILLLNESLRVKLSQSARLVPEQFDEQRAGAGWSSVLGRE